MSDSIGPPPAPTRPDRAMELARAFVGEFPGGSVVVGIAEEVFGTALARREEAWLHKLWETLLELQEREVDIGEVGERPEFLTAVRDATRIAYGEHLEEKLDMLKAVLVNAAIRPQDRVADVMTLRYLQWVDELEPEHVAALRYCEGRPRTFGESNEPTAEQQTLQAGLETIAAPVLALAASDLASRDLVVGRGIRQERTPGGPVRPAGNGMFAGGGERVRGVPTTEPVASDLSNAWATPAGSRFLEWLSIV